MEGAWHTLLERVVQASSGSETILGNSFIPPTPTRPWGLDYISNLQSVSPGSQLASHHSDESTRGPQTRLSVQHHSQHGSGVDKLSLSHQCGQLLCAFSSNRPWSVGNPPPQAGPWSRASSMPTWAVLHSAANPCLWPDVPMRL